MRVLIADDNALNRHFLQATLEDWGYEVTAVADGEEAWQSLQPKEAPQLAILDWMMPVMDGTEVCRLIRARSQAPYVYVILLTSKDSKEDIVEGMDAGADDYLTKPFNPHELQVRLRAGRRILDLESALLNSMEELAQAHKREVEIGARIQQTLLLGRLPSQVHTISAAALTVPSQQIDGDFYDFFKHSDRCLDVVVGDVMGKGVAAALLGAAVKSHLLRSMSQLVSSHPHGRLPEPEELIDHFHSEVSKEFIGLESFATLCYARFDLDTNRITFVDCGHTKTIQIRNGACIMLEGENMPLGFSEREAYKQVSRPFEKGDLFFFYSDGVTDAHGVEDETFGVDRLIDFISMNASQAPEELIESVRREVIAFSGSERLSDDLTCVALKISDTHDEIEVSSQLVELARVRSFVEDFCKTIGSPALDDDAIYELELAVNEAASNIIRHAYHERSDQKIHIDADAGIDQVVIYLYHAGDPFDGSAVAPSFDGSREGGFGVFLITQCVDEVEYSRDQQGRNCISLTKRSRRQS